APPGSEDRERQAKQAGDRDGAAAREQPLGDVIAVEAAAQLARILREGPADLLPGGVVDRGRFHDRPEPGERDRGRHRKGDNPGPNSFRETVAGSARDVNEPPCPAAIPFSETCAITTPIPPHVERKSALPAS